MKIEWETERSAANCCHHHNRFHPLSLRAERSAARQSVVITVKVFNPSAEIFCNRLKTTPNSLQYFPQSVTKTLETARLFKSAISKGFYVRIFIFGKLCGISYLIQFIIFFQKVKNDFIYFRYYFHFCIMKPSNFFNLTVFL